MLQRRVLCRERESAPSPPNTARVGHSLGLLFGGSPSRSPLPNNAPYSSHWQYRNPLLRSLRLPYKEECYAGRGSRTLTGITSQRILSPLRLPFRHPGCNNIIKQNGCPSQMNTKISSFICISTYYKTLWHWKAYHGHC